MVPKPYGVLVARSGESSSPCRGLGHLMDMCSEKQLLGALRDDVLKKDKERLGIRSS